jgi:prophage regulatory protein
MGEAKMTGDTSTLSMPTIHEKLLRLAEVRSRVPYSRATIYRLVASLQFPRPVSLGERAVAWKESDIDAWIQARIDRSAATEAR